MPGASKFYRSSGAQAASSANPDAGRKVNGSSGAAGRDILSRRQRLLCLPPFISPPPARCWRGTLLCLGRPVIGEAFSHGALANRLEVWVDGSPLLIERLSLADGQLACVAQQPWVGTMLFYPANETLLEGVREKLTPLANYAGATLTDGLLTVRFLSDDNLRCQRAMRDIWQFMRPHLTGKSPVLPRIWLT